tara:strand:+ start:291 stop:608 length:318 start_codon:yes stop_codon:yes gene_type:complete
MPLMTENEFPVSVIVVFNADPVVEEVSSNVAIFPTFEYVTVSYTVFVIIDAVKEFQKFVFDILSEQLIAIFVPVTEELLSSSKTLPPNVIVSPSVEPDSLVPPAV